MGNILNSISDSTASGGDEPVRCPVCGAGNTLANTCRHVRWQFDQGDPITFAQCALEVSPYIRNRGGRPGDIPRAWWPQNGDAVIDLVLLHFAVEEPFVFGELSDLDLLARDVWRLFKPEPLRAGIQRIDV